MSVDAAPAWLPAERARAARVLRVLLGYRLVDRSVVAAWVDRLLVDSNEYPDWLDALVDASEPDEYGKALVDVPDAATADRERVDRHVFAALAEALEAGPLTPELAHAFLVSPFVLVTEPLASFVTSNRPLADLAAQGYRGYVRPPSPNAEVLGEVAVELRALIDPSFSLLPGDA